MQNALQVPQRNVAFQALDDQVEIFFNRNTRLLVIELELPATSVNHVSKVRLTSERSQPNTWRSEEHTSELQSRLHLVCRLLLEKKKPGTRRRALGPRN